MSLAAQQDEIVGAIECSGIDRGRGMEMEVAKWAFDPEAGVGKLRGTARTDQEGDVASDGQQMGAKVAAERAGADDEDSHESIVEGCASG